MDGGSSATSSRRPRRSAQPLPSQLNPSFQASVRSPRTTVLCNKTPSMSRIREAAAVPSSSPRLVHLRPLSTSREADYLNLAYQRGFMGRFRCATTVVVRTPAAATSHSPAAVMSQPHKDETTENSGGHVGPSQGDVCPDPATPPTTTGTLSHVVPDEVSANGVSAGPVSGVATDGSGISGRHAHATGLLTGSSALLSRPRLITASRAASVISGSTTRRGRVDGRANGRPLPPSASASVAASSLPRRSLRSTPMLRGLRRSSSGVGAAAGGGVPAANMDALVKSGLHTSLWMAAQDGGLEVRSMANPNQVLASLPRRDARPPITALTAVCDNRVVAGHTDGSLVLFDASTLQVVGQQQPHTAAVTHLLYVEAATARRAATSVVITEGHVASSHLKGGEVQTSSLLLAASLDRTITVWEAASMTLMHRLKGNMRGVCALAATSTGGYAFSGSDEGTIRMWDAVRGQQWGITKDERAQLGKRSSEEVVAAGGGVLASRTSQRFSKKYTESSRSASGSGSDDDDDEGEHDSASGSPRLKGLASQPGQPTQLQHLRPSVAPRHVPSHRRALVGYGGVKVVPRATSTLNRGTLTLQQQPNVPGPQRGNTGPSHTSSRSLPATEDDTFAPTDTATSSSPSHDRDGALAGLSGGVSPLRRSLNYEAAKRTAAEGSGAVQAASLDYGYDVPVPTRKHRMTSTKLPRPAGGEAIDTAVGVLRGRKKSSKGKVSTTGKRKKAKKAKKASASATTIATAARSPSNVLEQRLENWFRLYQQRVLLSAASQRLTSRFTAGYDALNAMNWPIECAHIECITALTVVEDRLLVSASCDATAKVFALPSGQYVRTLTSSRRMPLAGLMYDSSVGRIYTGFSDGAVSVYDLSNPELPLLSQLQSPQTILSCTFAALAAAPMQRFVVGARVEVIVNAPGSGADPETAVVTTVAQFDKTTLAHGPNLTTSSYRVGQPSLRELNAAVSLQPLQQQRAAHLVALMQRSAAGTLEEAELRDKRQCGLVLVQAYQRRQTERVFFQWRRWALRRVLLRKLSSLSNAQAKSMAHQLLGQCMHRWQRAVSGSKKTEAGAVLRAVQLRGSDAALLSVPAEVRSGVRCTLVRIATAMVQSLTELTRRRVYHRWREFQRIRCVELRQSVGFNRLLLSMNAGAYAPVNRALARLICTATRRANHSKALWLLTELTERWQSQRQRRLFFDRWRAFARQQQRLQVRLEQETWRLVEPLSSTLVQPQVLRRRYFDLWRNFALYVARSGQLTSERETLQGEWGALQQVLAAQTTVAELKTKAKVTEATIAKTASERAALAECVQTLTEEDTTLRTEEALRVLIAGYYVPDASTATAVVATAATPTAAAASPRARLNARRTSVASAVDSGGVGRVPVKSSPSGAASCGGIAGDGAAAEDEQKHDRKLLMEASAVLRALKGNCVQCARDDKLLAKAHALALRLPIVESLVNDLSASAVPTPSHRAGALPQQQQRPAAWSVSSAKNGTSTAVAASPQQRRRYSTLSASVSSGGSAVNVAGASSLAAGTASSPVVGAGSNGSTARTSVAQMWAAQPAEESYPSLADAFNSIYASLLGLLYGAVRECGVVANAASRCVPAPTAFLRERLTEGEGERDATASDGLQAPVVAPSWLAQVPLKQRRTMVGEVLKLVTLFDSFAAHSDLPVERAGSISTRGAANTRALPLSSLCSHETAQSLLRHAAVLLELVDPQLWPRQLKLNHLQDAYAAAIAELNATVSSSHFSDGRPHSSTVMTHSESEGRDASPLPTPLAVRPPALCLSAEVLQRAAETLQPQTTASHHTPSRGPPSTQLGARASPTTTTTSGSDGQPKPYTTGRGSIAPVPSTLLLPNLDAIVVNRSSCGGSDEKLNGTFKSTEEEGQTPTPDLQHAHSTSFSHRTFSAVSTPRSYTPRTATSSVAGTSAGVSKPYLGFRVNVTRESRSSAQRTATAIIIRDVAAQYVNADGVEVDGPALMAGLQAGDQLIRFAGYAVTDLAAFNAVVSRHVHGGAELPVVVQRNEELLSTTIVVGTRIA
jgi:WD40 repeat protein